MARQAVIDASVILKWFLDEPGSESARRLRDMHVAGDVVLVVPELAFLEVLNIVATKQRVLEDLLQIGFLIQPMSEELLQLCCLLAVKHTLTAYDALYLAVSRQRMCQLHTFDKALLKALDNAPSSI